MVEEIKEFSSEFQVGTFTYLEVLDSGEIGVYKTRSVKWGSIGVSKFSGSGACKTIGIKKSCDGVIAEPAVANLIGSVGTAVEVYARTVVTRDYEEWESRGDLFDHIDFPVSQERVYGSTPIIAELFAFAEG
jgi:hypothetical protein